MRFKFEILAVLLFVLFVSCRSETRVEESTTAGDVLTTDPAAQATVPPMDSPTLTDTVPVPEATSPQASPAQVPPTQTAAATRQAAPPTATTGAAPATPPAQATPATPAPTPSAPPPQTTPAPTPTPSQPAASTPSRLPRTHNVDRGGVMHAPGMENPTQRCGACHGKDLRGGKTAPSCFDCHEQKW